MYWYTVCYMDTVRYTVRYVHVLILSVISILSAILSVICIFWYTVCYIDTVCYTVRYMHVLMHCLLYGYCPLYFPLCACFDILSVISILSAILSVICMFWYNVRNMVDMQAVLNRSLHVLTYCPLYGRYARRSMSCHYPLHTKTLGDLC